MPDWPKFNSAAERSRDLLFAHLSSSQRRDFVRKSYFDCKGSATGRTYRIYSWSARCTTDGDFLRYIRNIHRVIFVWGIGSYCSQPDYSHPVPEYDRLLTQKLAIEANEKYFLKNAEFHLNDNFVAAAATFVCAIASGLFWLIL